MITMTVGDGDPQGRFRGLTRSVKLLALSCLKVS
jgi:hypothetical protein